MVYLQHSKNMYLHYVKSKHLQPSTKVDPSPRIGQFIQPLHEQLGSVINEWLELDQCRHAVCACYGALIDLVVLLIKRCKKASGIFSMVGKHEHVVKSGLGEPRGQTIDLGYPIRVGNGDGARTNSYDRRLVLIVQLKMCLMWLPG